MLTTAATMFSISCLICRITTARRHHLIGYAIGCLIAVWAIVCWFLRIFICDLPRPWDITNNICLNRSAIRLGTTITNALVELVIVVSAVSVVLGVLLPRRPKVCVMIAFSMRLGVLPAMFVRLVFYNQSAYRGDETYGRAKVEILTQIAMNLSIILMTLPCAKPFFVIFEGGVFRPPHDQNIQQQQRARNDPMESTTVTLPRVYEDVVARRIIQPSDGGGCCSLGLEERAQRVAEKPTWDRRATFAKPSMPKSTPERRISWKSSIKMYPLSWNRRISVAQKTPPPAAYSAYFHKPSTSSASTRTPKPPLPLYNRIIRPDHRQRASDNSGSPSSWSRRSIDAY